MIVGSHLAFLWTRAVVFMVSNMSRLLLLAGPSVPNPTGKPASPISRAGGVPPPARFMFETGEGDNPTPFFPNKLTLLFVSPTAWAGRAPLFKKANFFQDS